MINIIEKDLKNKLTKKDYFLYLISRNVFILSSPLIILALIVAFIFMVKENGFQTNDFLFLAPILLFIFSYYQLFRAINTAFKANKETQKLKIILDNSKYKEITENGENSLEYSKFDSYYENQKYYYLYVDKINALILPKREFSKEELNTLNKNFGTQIRKNKTFQFKTLLGIAFSLLLLVSVIILIIEML